MNIKELFRDMFETVKLKECDQLSAVPYHFFTSCISSLSLLLALREENTVKPVSGTILCTESQKKSIEYWNMDTMGNLVIFKIML